jgi:hypothetical protein
MKAPAGTRKNATNSGGHKGNNKFEISPDVPATVPDLTGGRAPAVHEGTRKNHLNRGGFKGGMAAHHDETEKPDAPVVPTDIMDAE